MAVLQMEIDGWLASLWLLNSVKYEVHEVELTGFPEKQPVAVSLSQVSVFEILYVKLCLQILPRIWAI